MSRGDDLDRWLDGHRGELLRQLIDWVRIPSISADPEHTADVRRSAEFLAAAAGEAGFPRAELWETAGHPAVFAERMEDPRLPTVLIYAHHDVQPADPLDEWTSPPFEPVVVEGELRGRGVVDDKQNVCMHLEAVRAHLAVVGRMPVNLRLLVEGEEESGSAHFEDLIRSRRSELAADLAVISDTGMLGPESPALTIGLRGLVYWEVRVAGPAHDLHSGLYGGTVANPVLGLATLLAGLHDGEGRVAVPGFYEAVRVPGAAERQEMARIPFDEAGFLAAAEVPGPSGERGWSTLERRTVRPTLDVCGIWGGYAGAGAKTIIPARCGVKLSARIVPDQDPDIIADLVRRHLLDRAPAGLTTTVEVVSRGRWVSAPADHPALGAAGRAVEAVWGRAPSLVREGGSIPPVAAIAAELGRACVLFGVGLPDDRFHAPNERLRLEQLHRGTRAAVRLWDELGTLGAAGLGRPAGPASPG